MELLNMANQEMPPSSASFEDKLEYLKNFKPPLLKLGPGKGIKYPKATKLMPKKKDIRHYTPQQLKRYHEARTAEGKMNALEIPRGKRANIEIKKKVIHRLWKTEHIVKTKHKHSDQRRYIEALADHIAGETITDASLKYGIEPKKLHNFKMKFMNADSLLPQFIEGLFEHAAISAIAIWNDKKDSLSAKDAALSAGIFAEKAIMMKKARKTDYKDENVTLATLQKMSEVMDRVSKLKIIDIEPEIVQLPENATDSN